MANPARHLFVDSHVHFHDCFSWPAFLDAALGNFQAAADEMRVDDYVGVLILCDTSQCCRFLELTDLAQTGASLGAWKVHLTDEPTSVLAANDSARLWVISGRQIQTQEGIELLALCSADSIPEQLPAEECAKKILRHGGIPVIPWGFGKWIGRRGKIVDRMIGGALSEKLLLGDNFARTPPLGTPPQFLRARERHIPILAGSDPLPFPGQERQVGSYGVYAKVSVDTDWISSSIKEVLNQRNHLLKTYGKTSRLGPFLRNQLRIQLRKQLG